MTSLTNILRRLFAPAPVLPRVVALGHDRIDADERKALREWLEQPLTQRALGYLEASRPPLKHVPATTAELNGQRALEQLALVRGWTSYRNSLLLLGHTPQEVRQIVETYPD